MSKKKKENVPVLLPNITENKELVLADIEKFKGLVKQTMPQFIAEVENREDMANAMYATAQEILLVIEDALIRHHGWGEDNLKQLHKEISPVLEGVKEYEKHGLTLLSPGDISIVGELVETRYIKERTARAGLETPILTGAVPFIKKLKERNRDR